MVIQSIDIGRNKFAVSVVFINGSFEVATVWDGEVLVMSEVRCNGVVEAGECVRQRVNRLTTGCLLEEERCEVGKILKRRGAALEAEARSLGVASAECDSNGAYDG